MSHTVHQNQKNSAIYYAGMIKPQRLKIKISALVIISTTFPKKCAHFANFSVLRVVHYGLKRRINCNLAEQCIVSYKLLKITVNCSNKLKVNSLFLAHSVVEDFDLSPSTSMVLNWSWIKCLNAAGNSLNCFPFADFSTPFMNSSVETSPSYKKRCHNYDFHDI